jgi:hypothetical protein
MDAAEIKQMLTERPFVPFVIKMSGGRRIKISRPRRLAFSRNRKSVAVALRTGGFAILNLQFAMQLEPAKKISLRRKS